NTPEGLQVLTSKESLGLLKSMIVMSGIEVKVRQEEELEEYVLHGQTEWRVVNEQIYSYILPAAVVYQNKLLDNVKGLKEVQIEGMVFNELIYSYIIPAAVVYQNKLIDNVKGLKEVYGDAYKKMAGSQLDILERISGHMGVIKTKTDAMVEERKKANNMEDIHKKAFAYCERVKPYFDEIRYHCDKLERLVDDEIWPLTKYRELLFIK